MLVVAAVLSVSQRSCLEEISGIKRTQQTALSADIQKGHSGTLY